MKKKVRDYITLTIGILLCIIGFIGLKMLPDAQGILQILPYISIGIGCGAFGHSIGNLINQSALQNAPDVKKRIAIEEKDERNIAIANRAKAKAYDAMLYIFGTLMLIFALLNVSLTATLLLVFSYLFIVGCNIFYRLKYEKEM